jgi:hypothetical protein
MKKGFRRMTSLKTKALAAIALMLAAAPLPALAKVFPVPAEDPIATINVPDAWEPETFEEGVEMTSPDTKVYIAAEEVEAADLTDAVTDTVKTLAKQGLEIDTSTKKASDITINGLKAHDFTYTGKDKDGPANFSITLVETSKPGAFLMLSYWGSEEGEKANADALHAISQSIQATK